MAGIIKGNPNEKKEVSLESLLVAYEKKKTEIRSLKKNRNEISAFSSEEKEKLKTLYTALAAIAKSLAEKATVKEVKAKYRKEYKEIIEKAKVFGSVISGYIPDKTFDDIKGLDDVKKLVESFVFLLENPHIMEHYHLEGGMGMLMFGAPGTGKTMFAEAIANKMNLPLFIVTPADIFKSYVGESEQAVKQIFQEIDACPDGAILFVDECESIFSRRTSDTKDYKSAVTTELLQRINGFGVDGSKRIMIAATNRPEIIDPAYLRHKRFSHLVHVTPPDETALKAIIASKIKKPIELKDITVDEIYELSEKYTHKIMGDSTNFRRKEKVAYYSGADISGICEEACRLAIEEMQKEGETKPRPLTREMFEKAFTKIVPSISVELLEEYENFRKLGEEK